MLRRPSPLLLACGLAGGMLLGGGDALAAPFTGQGTAPIAEGGDRQKSRRQALDRARRAALEAALAEIAAEGGSLDAGARRRVLESAPAWTSAYRILEQGDDGATATIEVEVEVDRPRLEKLLLGAAAAATTTAGAALPVLGEVSAAACPSEVRDHLRDAMIARGLVVAEGSTSRLTVQVECEALGLVAQARVHGARIAVKAFLPGEVPIESEALGFAGDPTAAAHEALRRALVGLGDALRSERDTSIVMTIDAPWPAARVRRVEKAIRDSVVGVRSVALAGVEPDGAVRLRIDAALSAEALAAKLGALTIPGAPLRILGVAGPRSLSATLAAQRLEVPSVEVGGVP